MIYGAAHIYAGPRVSRGANSLPIGQWVNSRYNDMKTDRRPVEEWWQLISEFVVPRKSYITDTEDYPDDSRYRRLYDTTAIDACAVETNGHASYITPAEQRWFDWFAPDHIATDEVTAWYRKCAKIAALELAACNFYTNLHEMYEDRVAFGIGCMSVWPGKRFALNFRSHTVGTYAIEENDEGYVDGVCFEFPLGIRQIVEMFGEKALVTEGLRDSWQALRDGGKNKTHKILHYVGPRRFRDPRMRNALNMPFQSVYLAIEGLTVMHETGMWEFPYGCSRYLKHSGKGNQYGFSPSWRAMPAIGQLNFNEKILDLVAERQAVPSILVPDYLDGDVDIRAGGQTVFKASRVKGAYALPQEWGNQGRYDIGVERSATKRDDINRAFHVDLFRMWAQLEKQSQMTMLEVNERASEKLVQFSPSFTRFTADFEVVMNRVFGILLRAGKFPPPPAGAIRPNPLTGQPFVENPKVVYQSKIALAIQSLENAGIDRTLERAAMISQAGDPGVWDHINTGAAVRITGRNDAAPEELFNSLEEVQAKQAQRAEMEQNMAMAEMAERGAKAAGAVGMKVPAGAV